MPESSERGALTEAVFYILLSEYTPLHGYAVMQSINRLSDGRVLLGAGTLYGAINTLLDRKWIAGVPDNSDSRKKEYVITNAGKSAIEKELERLTELLNNGKKIVGGALNEKYHS